MILLFSANYFDIISILFCHPIQAILYCYTYTDSLTSQTAASDFTET